MYVGYLLPESKKHVTLTFNGHDEDYVDYVRAVRATAELALNWYLWDAPNVDIEYGEMTNFQPSGAWVALVKPDDAIMRLQSELVYLMQKLSVPVSIEFDYRPHTTLTYFKKPKKNPYEGLTFAVDAVSVVSDQYGVTRIPMNRKE